MVGKQNIYYYTLYLKLVHSYCHDVHTLTAIVVDKVHTQFDAVIQYLILNIFVFITPKTIQDDVAFTNDTRLRAIVPTTKFFLSKGANDIFCFHFGRPKGEIAETAKNKRLNPVVPHVSSSPRRK